MTTTTKPTLAERLPELARWVEDAKKHGTVYYLIESVSKSGMTRKVSLWTVVDKGNGPQLSPAWCDRNGSEDQDAARHVDWSSRHRCFKVRGCGMDMVFHLLDILGSAFGHDDLANGVRRTNLSRAE